MKFNSTRGNIPPNLRDELNVLFPGSDDWEIIGPVRARRDGEFFQARSARAGTSVAVKIFRGKFPSSLSDPAGLEPLGFYQTNPRLTIPRLLAVTRDPEAVIMEWIDAPLMIDLLRKHRFSRPKRLEQIQTAGRWLAWFHSVSERTWETYDPATARNRFARMIRARGIQPQGALAAHFDTWDRISAGIGPFETDHALLHRDFTPFNLFVEPSRVTGFDIFGRSRGPVAHDICRFLTYLSVHRLFSPMDSGPDTCGLGKSEIRAFMDGYGMPAGGIPHFLFLQYTEILRRWLSLHTQAAEGSFRIGRYLQIRRLSQMADGAAEELTAN